MNPVEQGWRQALVSAVGEAHVLTEPVDMGPYCTDWHGRYRGRARAVVRPRTAQEVAQVLRVCQREGIAVVPQGGNTGLCGGATPDDSGQAIVLHLGRLNQLRALDPVNGTITVEAGMVLAQAQQHAREAGMLFPLSLAAEGSCTIGGNLATNAGGTGVLRYGNARDLTLGLEVVTATGELWDGLRSLRKDNTGYSLKDLFVGSEGTLGIITAAVLKLYPQPAERSTAFIGVSGLDGAVRLLKRVQQAFGADVTAFEVMSRRSLELVERQASLGALHITPSPWAVLLEMSCGRAGLNREALEAVLAEAMEEALVLDAAIAVSLEQAQTLWAWRERIPVAQSAYGGVLKHDISLPISALADFEAETSRLIHERWPLMQTVVFGHAGDGNLHYNVALREPGDFSAMAAWRDEVLTLVHDQVALRQGSFSAEHGIGQSKRQELGERKSAEELALMRGLKAALDPKGILNPGKVLP